MQHVHPDAIICSDQWAAYRRLAQHGFIHQTVNHSRNFVSPTDASVHTQSVENSWRLAKKHLRERHAKDQRYLDDYVAEWMWRQLHQNESKFRSILQDIAVFWPPGMPKASLRRFDDEESDSESDDASESESSAEPDMPDSD